MVILQRILENTWTEHKFEPEKELKKMAGLNLTL